MLSKEKLDLIKKNGKDTGSTAVQMFYLTEKINNLNEHFKKHKKDKAGHRGLMVLVGLRNKLSKYLLRKDEKNFRKILDILEIRK
jgi:small subunit ribosomal protein S15